MNQNVEMELRGKCDTGGRSYENFSIKKTLNKLVVKSCMFHGSMFTNFKRASGVNITQMKIMSK
jgi:hypothetical protein